METPEKKEKKTKASPMQMEVSPSNRSSGVESSRKRSLSSPSALNSPQTTNCPPTKRAKHDDDEEFINSNPLFFGPAGGQQQQPKDSQGGVTTTEASAQHCETQPSQDPHSTSQNRRLSLENKPKGKKLKTTLKEPRQTSSSLLPPLPPRSSVLMLDTQHPTPQVNPHHLQQHASKTRTKRCSSSSSAGVFGQSPSTLSQKSHHTKPAPLLVSTSQPPLSNSSYQKVVGDAKIQGYRKLNTSRSVKQAMNAIDKGKLMWENHDISKEDLLAALQSKADDILVDEQRLSLSSDPKTKDGVVENKSFTRTTSWSSVCPQTSFLRIFVPAMSRCLSEIAYITSILSAVHFEDYKRESCSPVEAKESLESLWDFFLRIAWLTFDDFENQTLKCSQGSQGHVRLYNILYSDKLEKKYGSFREQLRIALNYKSPLPKLEEGIAKGKKILIMWTHQIRNQQITNFLVGLRRVRGFCKKLLIHKITNRFSDEKKNNSTYYCSRVLVGQLLGGENCSFPAVQGFESEDGRDAVENFVSKELAPLVPKFQQTTLKSDNAFSKKNAPKESNIKNESK